MTGADTARTVIGIIGNVISFSLFASPCPTFWRILRKKSTEEFRPDPYLATFLNCVFWVFYGLPIVHPNSTLVVTINGVGVVIMVFYITIFLIYGNNRQRLRIFIVLSIGLVFFAGIVVLTLLEFHTNTTRSNFIGILCTILVVLMYLSPLTVMKKVIQTKSVEYMPFFLSLTNLLNAVVWLAYALIHFDLYITIGNGLGAISGSFQLILYAVYYKSTPKPDAVEKLPRIQLAEANPTRPDEAV